MKRQLEHIMRDTAIAVIVSSFIATIVCWAWAVPLAIVGVEWWLAVKVGWLLMFIFNMFILMDEMEDKA